MAMATTDVKQGSVTTTVLPSNNIVGGDRLKNISEEQYAICLHEKNKLTIEVMEQRKMIEQLTSQKNTLEECLRSLNDEFDKLSVDYGNVLTANKKMEKSMNNMRNKGAETKKIVDDLVQTNSQLTNRIIEVEQHYKNSIDQVKALKKKVMDMTTGLEEAEASNKKLKTDLSVKEEKYNIMKVMNERLEGKSHQIIRRMESVIAIEQKMNEYLHDRTNLENKINQLHQKVTDVSKERDAMIKKNQLLCKDKDVLEKEINKFKESLTIISNRREGSNYNSLDDKMKLLKCNPSRSFSAKHKQ